MNIFSYHLYQVHRFYHGTIFFLLPINYVPLLEKVLRLARLLGLVIQSWLR